jgi:peptidyl-prolyl cis-trans isomerase B (cyclophilin B)
MRPALGPVVLVCALLASGCGGKGSASAKGCEKVKKPSPRAAAATVQPPRTKLDSSRTWALSFQTSCGMFVVRLDTELAPNTTASLVKLARAGYFDDTIFHRIVPDFVIQGGDPTQTGSGSPGYWMRDVPPASARYTKGTVAMAKTTNQPAGLAGSQFFVVTAGDAGLPPEYAIVGRVTQGMDVVDRIGKLGDQMEHPTQTVLVRKVLVVEHAT